MWGGGGTGGSGGGGGLDPSALAGYATMGFVEDNYVSKAFFNQLFEYQYNHRVLTKDGETVVSDVTTAMVAAPNEVVDLVSHTETDEETGYTIITTNTITGIKAKAGLWTNQYLSALGQNSGGGGGGGATLFEPLLSINESGLAAPTDAQDGMTVVWDKNTHKWKYGATGGGGITVDSALSLTSENPVQNKVITEDIKEASAQTCQDIVDELIGSGGGGGSLNQPLSAINSADLGTPSQSGVAIMWNGTAWVYQVPGGGTAQYTQKVFLAENGGVLTQAMINTPNTIYVVQYNYDLNDGTLNIPQGCLLEFAGGHIYNGHFIGNFDNNEYNITDFMSPGTTDITDALNMLVDMQKHANRKISPDGKYYCKQCSIYIPGGLWECGEIEISYTFYATIIKGELNFFPPESTVSGTVIQPRSSNQTYIWRLGCVERWTFNIVIENITFSDFGATKCNLTEGALSLLGCSTCWFKGLQFRYMNGCCIKISSSWELDFDTINLREIGGVSSPKIWFADTTPLGWEVVENISQINIGTLYYEAIDGTVLRSDANSVLDNVTIDNIIGEYSSYTTMYIDRIDINDISDADYAAATSISLIDIRNAHRFTISNINNAPPKLTCARIGGVLYKYDTIVKFGGTGTNLQIGNLTTSLSQATTTRKIDVIHGTGGYLQITNIFLNNSSENATSYNLSNVFRLYCNKVLGLSIGSVMANSANGVVNFAPMLEMYNAYKYAMTQRLDNNGIIMYDEVIPGLHLGILPSVSVGLIISLNKNPFTVYAIDIIAKTGGAFKQYILYGNDGGTTINMLRNSNGGYLCATKNGESYYYDQIVYDSATCEINKSIYFTGIEGAVYIVAVHEVFANVSNRTISNSLSVVDKRLTYGNVPNAWKSNVILPNTTGTSSQRPTGLGASHIGAQYFENANGVCKPIYWTNDTSNGKSGWVDATGADMPNP